MKGFISVGEFLVKRYGNAVGYIAIGLLVVLAILFSYGSYVFARWINWELSYASNVQTMICETVRPEAIATGVCGKE